MTADDEIPVVAVDGIETITAVSALESTLSFSSDTLQLASMAFQLIPAMAGVAAVLGGISSWFDAAGKTVDGIDQIHTFYDEVIQSYDQHPDPAAHPQVAEAFLAKALALIGEGHLAEALSACDDLVGRFGQDADPAVARSVRLARISATEVLNKQHSFEEAVRRCDVIVERYGSDTDRATVADVLIARLNKLEALTELQQAGEAIASFAEIISICDTFDGGGAPDLDARVRQNRVIAIAIKSVVLLRQGKADEALAACDEVIQRFTADQSPEVRSAVTRCLLVRAVVLHRLERWQEEIEAFDEITAAHSGNHQLRTVALNARFGKIGLLLQLSRFRDAVRACDETRREFRSERAVRVTATVLEVMGWRGLGEHKKAVKACEEVVDLIGSAADLGSRQCIAYVLYLKAQSLWVLDRGDEAISVCDEADRRFGGDPDLVLRREVAHALSYKGAALVLRQRRDEAMAVMSTIVARYGQSADPELIAMTTRAQSRLDDLG